MDSFDEFPGFVLFAIGRTPITVGSLAAALAVAVGAYLLARAFGHGVRRLRSRSAGGGASLYIVEKLVTYGLIVAGGMVAINMLGVNLTSLAVFAGAVGIGVGLGLQGVVKEFVSGLVLIFEGAVQVGDYVELEGGGRGEIREIGARATRVRNNDNIEILVPNSKLVEERVTTWTHRGASRRLHIPFTVAYGADKALVREAVLEAARAVPFTLPDTAERKTQVWLVGFGDSALKFELLVWPELAAVKRPASAAAAYNWAIEDALRAHGVEIPYPQLDVRVRSVLGREGDVAARMLRLEDEAAPAPAPEAPEPAPSTNDAVQDLQVAKAHDVEVEAARDADVPRA